MNHSTFQSAPEDGAIRAEEFAAEAGALHGRLGRILLVTSNFPRWANDSTTPFVLHLAQDLQDQGWTVHVLAPHAPGAKPKEVLGGVQVERFRYLWPDSLQTLCYGGGALINLRKHPTRLLQVPFFILAEWLAVLRRLARGGYDLLHSHWVVPQGFTGVLAAKLLGVPHVVTAHGSDVLALRGRFLARFKRIALRHAAAVTVNSTVTEKAVLEIAEDSPRVQTIPMGVSDRAPSREAALDIRREHRKGDGPCLVTAGRLVKEKSVGDLIRAVALLVPRQPDVSAMILGDGPDRPALEQTARDLGVADRVFFSGWIGPKDVADHLAAADIFVAPSWLEGQGLAVLEAMLAGLPVIATRCSGIVDAVRHDETGLLVNQAAPKDIVESVLRLARDSDLARRLAVAGAKEVEQRFTRRASARAFSTLFRSLLSGKGAAA